LDAASTQDRKLTFDTLRKEFPIHELEKEWNVEAELILAAIARASDFTQRGVRGVIAEASFAKYIVSPLLKRGWKDITSPGDKPFDFELTDVVGAVRIQVKNQRRLHGQPMLWKGVPGVYDAETDKSRKGKKKGEDTRPYRFGEFDVLAVCMHPSTNDWSKFFYSVGTWLLPRRKDPSRIAAHQPIDPKAIDEWTDDFRTVVGWLRSGTKKTITAPARAPRLRKP